MKNGTKIKPKDMQLGDVVCLPYEDGTVAAFGHSTVVRIDNGMVYLARPYIHTSDVSFVGNSLIRYIGLEEYVTELQRDCLYTLVSRLSKPIR